MEVGRLMYHPDEKRLRDTGKETEADTMAENQSYKEEYEALAFRYLKLEEDLEAEQVENEHLKAVTAELRDEVDTLEREVDNLQEEVDNLERENEYLEEEVSSVQDEADRLEREVEDLAAENRNLQKEVKSND